MSMFLGLWVWLVGVCIQSGVVFAGADKASDQFELTIRMPNSTSDRPDALVCHGQKLPQKEAYILRFVPHASRRVAHHMMVYGCKEPGSQKPYWPCSDHITSQSEMGICGSAKRQIVFSWAVDAAARNLPPGVGFRVGGTTGIDYIVIQFHYVNAFGAEAADRSGLTMVMTYDKQPQQAGYYVLGNVGSIPPHNPEFHLETGCKVDLNYTIYPFGYRTHGHNLATVTSGYRIRDGKWTELGRMSPQRPQTFYNTTTSGLDIHQGDYVASRCTFNSMNRTQVTKIGPADSDEMCNFYILYSTNEQRDLDLQLCFRKDSFRWSDHFPSIPADASSLKGIPGAAGNQRYSYGS